MSKNDQRTEKPTPKRKKEARKEGRVARSPELSSWLPLLIGSSLLPALLRTATRHLVGLEAQGADIISRPSVAGAWRMLDSGMGTTALIVGPLMLTMMVAGLVVNIGQVGVHFSPKALFHVNKLNPFTGFKRLLSFQGGLLEGAKASAKLVVIAGVAAQSLSGLVNQLTASASADLMATVSTVGQAALHLVRNVAMAGLAMAAADYLIARRRIMAGLRMTRQEVRDEMRQSDGDPHIRARIRQMQRRLSRMRMMAEVAKAHVVAVNPTHYAVALRYDPGSAAPRVVAKGTDHVALKIRELAMKNGVPVVSDPPLARALHAACELDDVIPSGLYLAVARLLAFVYSLPPVAKGTVVSHATPAAALALPA